MKSKIIGISGVAGAGKDLFYELLSEKVPCKRFSLGDQLKKELSPYCLQHFGIDPLNCSREKKNLIRRCLVSHASLKRELTQGRYWIEKVDTLIKNHIFNQVLNNSLCEFSCITDIRYDSFDKDEVFWLKKELNGILVHVSCFTVKDGKKVTKPPINSEEATQDPRLKSQADYILEWEFINKDQDIRDKTLNKAIEDFLKWLKKGPITKRNFLLTGP